jgi:hypothetical protein
MKTNKLTDKQTQTQTCCQKDRHIELKRERDTGKVTEIKREKQTNIKTERRTGRRQVGKIIKWCLDFKPNDIQQNDI